MKWSIQHRYNIGTTQILYRYDTLNKVSVLSRLEILNHIIFFRKNFFITLKESDFFAAGDKPTIVDIGIYDLDPNLRNH